MSRKIHYQRKVKKIRHKHPKAFQQITVYDFGTEEQILETSSRDVDLNIYEMEKNPDKITMIKLQGNKGKGEIAWYKKTENPFLFPINASLKQHDMMDLFAFSTAWYLYNRDREPKKEVNRHLTLPKKVRENVSRFMGKIERTGEERKNPRPRRRGAMDQVRVPS